MTNTPADTAEQKAGPISNDAAPRTGRTYAEVFAGVRQDSGDPKEYIQAMRRFYDAEGIKDKKTMVFSDSLNLELCLKYKEAAEREGFQPVFGVGTFLTSKCANNCGADISLTALKMISCPSQVGRSPHHLTLSSSLHQLPDGRRSR